jgi:hypothetical protein
MLPNISCEGINKKVMSPFNHHKKKNTAGSLTRIRASTFFFHATWALLVILLFSCSGYQYVASAAYVPQHSKQGEWKADVYPSNVQSGYSISSHMLLFASAHVRQWPGGKGNPFDEHNVSRYRETNISEISFGTGYFHTKGRFNYEILGGSGGGKIHYINKREKVYGYESDMRAHTQHYFIQPDIGFSIRDHFTFALFSRLDYCIYTHISTSTTLGVYSEPEFADQEFIGKDKVEMLVLIPGASVMGGWKRMKFQVQLSPNIKLWKSQIRQQLLNANIGLSFQLMPEKTSL